MKTGLPAWQMLLGLPETVPEWIIAILALCCIYLLVIIPSGAVLGYFGRKLGADLQARVGPNRAGPAGIFQPVADFLKLLQKQVRGQSRGREAWWMSVHTMALFSTVAVLPLGSMILLVDTDVSVFLPYWITLVVAFITLLMGLDQGTVPGWLGGMRVAAQALTGAFPSLIAILCVGVRSGGFRWRESIVASQGPWPYQWTVFSSPFEFIAFIVFMVSGLVLLGIPPLDGGGSRPDLSGGVAAQLNSGRLSLFKLSRFYSFFLWAILAAVLFLGGWRIPSGLGDAIKDFEAWRIFQLFELFTLLSKAFMLIVVTELIATVSPRLRSDQVTDMSWKVLSPFSLIALAGTALWVGWGVLG